jgi:hypothetical protein
VVANQLAPTAGENLILDADITFGQRRFLA